MNNNIISTLRVFVFTAVTLFTLNACTSTKTTDRSSSRQQQSENTVVGDFSLKLCKTSVTNPPTSINRKVSRKSEAACVNGINLMVAPAPRACLSSGFGTRNKRKHNGIDYQSKPAGNVVAAGNGTIIKVDFRLKDYGHWVIIDHGEGVYTSYAHLKNVSSEIKKGEKVTMGQVLGKMGKSGNATNAIHLHFEMRQGNYDNPKRWWGLSPIDPFKQGGKC